jgi:hypothetical protein
MQVSFSLRYVLPVKLLLQGSQLFLLLLYVVPEQTGPNLEVHFANLHLHSDVRNKKNNRLPSNIIGQNQPAFFNPFIHQNILRSVLFFMVGNLSLCLFFARESQNSDDEGQEGQVDGEERE